MTDHPARAFAIPLTFLLIFVGCQGEIASPDQGEIASSETISEAAATATTQRAHPLAQQATVSQQLNTVREATKKYRDIEAAREDGYFAVSPYVPGMGFHFAKGVPPFGKEVNDPPVLVYFTNGSYNPDPGEALDPDHDGDLILGAVEYIEPGDVTADPPNIFADEDSPRNVKTTEEEGWHFESEEGFTGLHAWVHRGNPEGVFHHTNRNID